MHSKLFLTLEYPPDVGGAGSFAADIIDAYKASFYITPFELRGVRVSRVLRPLYSINNRYLRFIIALVSMLYVNGRKINEVYCLNYSSYLIYQFIHTILGIEGKSIIWVLHGEEDIYLSRRESRRDRLMVSTRMLEFSRDNVIHRFVSLDLKNKFESSVYTAKNSGLLKHGINSEFWNVHRHELKNSKEISLIYTGRIVRDKGVFDLLKVMLRLPDHFILSIAGTGQDEDELKESILMLELEDRVTFLGQRSKHELRSDLCRSDCFIFLSYRSGETFGLSTFEAMSCDIPAIVLRQPYTDDFADKSWPYLIQSKDEISEELLLDIIETAKHKSPRKVVLDHYGLEDMVHSLII